MPKRQEPSRQQQAFLSLIDPQYAAFQRQSPGQSQPDRNAGTQGHRRQSSRKQQDNTGRVPGFQLRDAAPPRPADQYLQTAQQLQVVFEGIWDLETIQQVVNECKGSASAATDMLLDMAASTQPAIPSTSAQPSATSAEPAGIFAVTQYWCKQPCPYPQGQLMRHTGFVSYSSYWSWLPEECKGLVLRHLSSHDLAKAARTCKEFAEHIRSVRAGLTFLNIAPGETPFLWSVGAAYLHAANLIPDIAFSHAY